MKVNSFLTWGGHSPRYPACFSAGKTTEHDAVTPPGLTTGHWSLEQKSSLRSHNPPAVACESTTTWHSSIFLAWFPTELGPISRAFQNFSGDILSLYVLKTNTFLALKLASYFAFPFIRNIFKSAAFHGKRILVSRIAFKLPGVSRNDLLNRTRQKNYLFECITDARQFHCMLLPGNVRLLLASPD